nr:F-box domain-containing protein [Tanacetum cinerariifolium]
SLVGMVLILPPTLGRCYTDTKTEDGGRPVIRFDVEKEEFGLIDPPKRMCDLWRRYSCRYDQVVDLNGEVGYVCTRTMEVWLLKHKKEWVPHCRFKEEIVPDGLFIDELQSKSFMWCHFRGNKSFGWNDWLNHPECFSL